MMVKFFIPNEIYHYFYLVSRYLGLDQSSTLTYLVFEFIQRNKEKMRDSPIKGALEKLETKITSKIDDEMEEIGV